MLRILCLTLITALLFSSCSRIESRNFPGRAENTIPAAWEGRYIMSFPSALSSMEEKDRDGNLVKNYVSIQKNKIVWDHSPTITVLSLNDSLVISTVDGEKYISIQRPGGYYLVLHAKEEGRNLLLTGMYTDLDLSETTLRPYFDNAKSTEIKRNGETTTFWAVTIADRKLKDYFKSRYAPQDPIKLIRQ